MKKRRYYIKDSNADLFNKFKKTVFGKKIPPFPETIIIETITGCNAKCIFCDSQKLRDKLPSGRISNELVQKITDECTGYKDWIKRFCFHFDNEPLLDKLLLEKISYVKKKCPFVTTNITTNGILLTRDRIKEIYTSNVVDEINISIQSIEQATYETLTGVPTYTKVMANMDALAEIHKSDNGPKPVIEINTCLTPQAISERKRADAYWRARGFKHHYIKIDNRSQKGSKHFKKLDKSNFYYPYCRRPFHTMVICFDGVVPLCCADYTRDCVIGDANKSSIFDLWNGDSMYQARKEMDNGRFKHARVCATCMING